MPKSYVFLYTPGSNHLSSSIIFLSALFSVLHFSLSLPNKPHFGSNLVLIGDAKFASNSSCIQLTDPKISSPSSGFLIQKKPIRLLSSTTKSRKPVSFSTDFTFSISPHNGDGLAFLLVPRNFQSKVSTGSFGVSKESRYLGVEFDTLLDENVGDVNANHVGVDVDLGEMWRDEEVLVGLSSSSGKSMQTSSVYSWKFRTRSIPEWLHSQPLDPRAFSSKHSKEKLAQKRKICALGFLSGLVFMIGCGALLALIVLFLWALFDNGSETVLTIPTNCMAPSGGFRYEKINVVVGDNSTDAKN
ncbi:UNVERIFIED_CONTAM: L-type lectin-domain containing receptor kinase VIII.1 [Sesamum radiatum]|uniref:L-type lectin-domain containing receptor kinase VIII.1 n=1 Tax=Sesamum radiatum TaxID=300843 RepID=A0AAW2JY05_SESRA